MTLKPPSPSSNERPNGAPDPAQSVGAPQQLGDAFGKRASSPQSGDAAGKRASSRTSAPQEGSVVRAAAGQQQRSSASASAAEQGSVVRTPARPGSAPQQTHVPEKVSPQASTDPSVGASRPRVSFNIDPEFEKRKLQALLKRSIDSGGTVGSYKDPDDYIGSGSKRKDIEKSNMIGQIMIILKDSDRTATKFTETEFKRLMSAAISRKSSLYAREFSRDFAQNLREYIHVFWDEYMDPV